jgi:hypothetical protein
MTYLMGLNLQSGFWSAYPHPECKVTVYGLKRVSTTYYLIIAITTITLIFLAKNVF